MATVHSKKTFPTKTIGGKSVPGKSPPKPMPVKTTPSGTGSLKKPPPRTQRLGTNNDDSGCFVTLPPCQHLVKVLSSNSKDMVLKTYKAAMKIVVTKCQLDNHKNNNTKYIDRNGKKINVKLLRKLTSNVLQCKDCKESNSITHGRLFMCLQCTNIGCFSESHAFHHAKNSGHVFGIDPFNGELLCLKCGDLISHQLIEKIRHDAFKHVGLNGTLRGLPSVEVDHDVTNRQLIESSTRVPSFKDTLGLRGFINLGSTCFMSSILQTIIHNPFIKNYYLGGSHNSSHCDKEHVECMSCCLNEIYQDLFTNPSVTGYGLTSFVESAWRVKRSLAGYSEQDAHEFWQFLVHQIHKNDTTSSKYIKNKESTPILDKKTKEKSLQVEGHASDCDCIIHKTFSGTLQSTLTCTECGSDRKIIDPMLDISLEIQDKVGGEKVSLNDLHSCFKKYTSVEELDVLYECATCEKKTKVTKSLRLQKLPPVLSIQLKRFEHIGVSSKIDYHIDTPSVLNVNDYTANSIYNNQITNYELFGIVCHIGNVNTGHYIAYVKTNSGIWFKFDDAVVTRVSESVVKQVNGYMLFYCIKDFA